MHNLVILGASGSIGQSALKVLRHNPGRWQVLALTAARSVDAMLRDCLEFSPVSPSWWTKAPPAIWRAGSRPMALRPGAQWPGGPVRGGVPPRGPQRDGGHRRRGGSGAHHGRSARRQADPAGQQGGAGHVGRLSLWRRCAEHGAELLPIDSEHNAIFQCLPRPSSASRVWLRSGCRRH